jgi:hypothetical protein
MCPLRVLTEQPSRAAPSRMVRRPLGGGLRRNRIGMPCAAQNEAASNRLADVIDGNFNSRLLGTGEIAPYACQCQAKGGFSLAGWRAELTPCHAATARVPSPPSAVRARPRRRAAPAWAARRRRAAGASGSVAGAAGRCAPARGGWCGRCRWPCRRWCAPCSARGWSPPRSSAATAGPEVVGQERGLDLTVQPAQAQRDHRLPQLGRGGEAELTSKPVVLHGAHPGRCSISAAIAAVRWFDAHRTGAL